VNSLSQEKNTIIERIGNISDTFNQVVASAEEITASVQNGGRKCAAAFRNGSGA